MPVRGNATGWRRRALRLVELCLRLDAEHVLSRAMKRWPVAALLEATEEWDASRFAAVARDWRLKKVARLLEARGHRFAVQCCAEWEPEFLTVVLPQVSLVTARHVLAGLYFRSEDKDLSPYECRLIVEAFPPSVRRKLLRKFEERDVSRVLRAEEGDEDEDDEEDSEDDEDGEDSSDSLDDFIVDGETDGEADADGDEDADEEMQGVEGDDVEEGDDDEDDDDEEEEESDD
ncbi:hypothetical protein Agub_g7268 [Astrephomene gubernaculifera]|uniref:Uncharacterized protein n=1 Tax=Astrephomene gubernaculifera TaxID=47775 RepID=A0AAD3DRT7_9CHLO|nr:hypothetical protein Agub_g7268 [Astrephomene gubernaculifera]